MKVLDLQCSLSHVFEGWFGSETDFLEQQDRGLLQCPLCGDSTVVKKPSAPRLNLAPSRPAEAAPKEEFKTEPSPVQEVIAGDQALQAAWLNAARRLMAQTEDVGQDFAEEARKIHYGEAQERAIRGQASAQETQALLEEGIAVLPMPLPRVLKHKLQ